MAKEEIPDRMTKSVPLAGGMQDDVPEFLQEFPSLAYVENGRFRKANEVEKTLPETDFSPVSPPSGESLAVEEAGDTLLVVGSDGSREYSTASGWRSLSGSEGSISTTSDVASTGQASAGMNYDWAKSTINDEFYVIAYETREVALAVADEQFTLIIEAFTPGGVLLYKELIVNGRCPQVNQTQDGRVVVHYADNGVLGNFLEVYDTTTRAHVPVLDTLGAAIEVNDSHTSLLAINTGTSTVVWYDANGNPQPIANSSYNPLRQGWHPSGKNLFYRVSYAGSEGYLMWQNPGGGGSVHGIYLLRLGSTGVATVAAEQINVAPSTPETATVQYFPLDLNVNVTPYVVYAGRNAVANTTEVVVKSFPDDLTSTIVNETIDTGSNIVVNGTIAVYPLGLAWVAFTSIDGDETGFIDTASGRCNIKYGRLVSTTWTQHGTIPHHRLTSNIYEEFDTAVFSCEQFGFFEPSQKPGQVSGTQLDVVNPSLAGTKPTTNILMRVGVDRPETPIATFDATTSKHTNFSMQEQSTFLGRLRKDGDSFFYCNRQLLETEDISKRVRHNTSIVDLLTTNWYMGDYRGNLYEVDTSPEKIQTLKFGDSVILNTSIPQWYSGGDIIEMSVLEQPEVRFVDTGFTSGGDARAWSYIEPLGANPDEWSVYQVVVGYADASGQIHRSAPSFPLYVWGVENTTTDEEDRWVGYTLPITGFTGDARYFVEVYSAKYGTEPQLSYSSFVSSGAGVRFKDLVVIDYGGGDQDYDPIRTSAFVYTTAGGLAADPWPSFDQAVITSRRMFAIEGDTLYFSKLFEPNLAPEFNSVLSISFGRGRKLLAIGKIDDKVIVFEDDTIHAVYGDGPDNIGAGQAFIVDHLQTTMGCSDPESVIEIPEGLLFYSAGTQEFHLINRDLNIIDVGKAVQDLTVDIDIKASTLFPMEHEVRWYITGGPTNEFGASPTEPPTRPPRPRYTNVLPSDPVLVYNYHYDKWTVISGQPAVSATVFENDVVRIDDSWNVFRTSEQWANSNLVTYRLPWLRAQDLQNFARFRELDFLGKYLSDWADNGDGHEAGDIKITFRYDYEANGLYHEYLWKANTQFNPDDGDRLQFSAHPGKPKCQAIQVTVEEVPTVAVDGSEPTYTNGRGFVLSGLDLLYSLKRGLGSKSLGRSRRK